MPELPEVQTVVNTLKSSGLLKQKITKIIVFKKKLLKNSSVKSFGDFLINESFQDIERIGKYLIFHLSHAKVLVVHLRMEGKLFHEPMNNKTPVTHLRIQFLLKNKHLLNYYDSRIFGTFHIYQKNAYLASPHLAKLALDPLSKGFNWQYLKNHLVKLTNVVKTALLDQTNVSGIGNIYVDEILFMSKIHPLRKCNKLNDNDFQSIANHSKSILTKAIKFGGTTVSSYKWDVNHSGHFQQMLLVHTKKGKPCPICKTKIIKIKVNGRGTYLCPKCQK